jgi:uncharacterized membrane protein
MERQLLVYMAYIAFFALLLGSVFLTPYLAFSSDVGFSYSAFSATCHQKISRSLCLFSGGSGYWIGDCLPQAGKFVNDPADRTRIRVDNDGAVGYKMPVCSRDIGLYGAMLIGGIAYPFARRLNERKVYPAIYLVLAVVPLGLDGGVQFVSELGLLPFVYESTNFMRVATGAIAGFAAAFYAIPILVNLFSAEKRAAENQNRKQETGNPEVKP